MFIGGKIRHIAYFKHTIGPFSQKKYKMCTLCTSHTICVFDTICTESRRFSRTFFKTRTLRTFYRRIFSRKFMKTNTLRTFYLDLPIFGEKVQMRTFYTSNISLDFMKKVHKITNYVATICENHTNILS